MAITIGGLSQKKALELLDLSRVTLSRYRKDPSWPGDDAPLEMIQAFVSVKRSNRGRKKAKGAGPAAEAVRPSMVQIPPVDPSTIDVAELSELQALLGLDDELKRTVIEKNKAQIAAYQEKCLEEYRHELTTKMTAALLLVFEEISQMDLPREKLENVRKAILAARNRIMAGDGEYQPELI